MSESPIAAVANYYGGKFREYGVDPRGVDWNSEEGQVLRFDQLCKIISGDAAFSLNDIGCGYGALVDYLAAHYAKFSYAGADVAPEMVEAARARYPQMPHVSFCAGVEALTPADYAVASGIFNVKLDTPDEAWLEYIHATLDSMDRVSTRGFAFNCLTSYSDPPKMRPNLYYADPCAMFDFCKRRYSRQVSLLHDYGLYEFTVLVRKE